MSIINGNTEAVQKMISNNRRITIREVAYHLAHAKQCFGIKRVAVKIVPKYLNFGEFATFKEDPDLLKKAITGDESRVYGYDIENKNHSYQFKCPVEIRPKKAR